jgi:hypothetical protein
MKQGMTALAVMMMTWAGSGAAMAQMLPPMDGPDAYAYAYGHRRPIPPPPPHDGPGAYDLGLPSYEVMTILRSTGFSPLGAPARRGRFYMISAIHPNGDDGRLVIDAYSGRIVRFTPASRVIRATRGAPMVMVYQGPTFPPPSVATPGAPRPPGAVPRLASRSPASAPLVTPKPRPATAPPRPKTAQAPPVPAAAPPAASAPAAALGSAPATPPSAQVDKAPEPVPMKPVLQPTQPMPPVQTME